MQMQI